MTIFPMYPLYPMTATAGPQEYIEERNWKYGVEFEG